LNALKVGLVFAAADAGMELWKRKLRREEAERRKRRKARQAKKKRQEAARAKNQFNQAA